MIDIRHIVVRDEAAGIDIDAVHRRPHIPNGCDQQGRFQPCIGGPCQGGSKLCPSPYACERTEDEERNARPLPWYVAELVGVPPAIVTSLAVVMTIIGVVGALHWWLS